MSSGQGEAVAFDLEGLAWASPDLIDVSGALAIDYARHAHPAAEEAAQARAAVQPAPAEARSARAESGRLENRLAPIRDALDDRM